MPDSRLPIAPDTRVADLLEAYPALEAVLVSLAPAFSRLRNPILRRTVAKVATLDQAARIGGLATRDLVRQLRSAAGLAPHETPESGATAGPACPAVGNAMGVAAAPGWVHEWTLAAVVDADALLDRGEHPLGAVRRELATLGAAGMICVDSSFVPAPLIDALTKEGCEIATVPHAGRHRTYVRRT